jgi:hypothetical protein
LIREGKRATELLPLEKDAFYALGHLQDLAVIYTFAGEDEAALKEIEHEADTITHDIYHTLHYTFITPLDREDIHSLAGKMDTILDLIEFIGNGTCVPLLLGITGVMEW